MEQVLQKSEMLEHRFADIKVRVSHMTTESSIGSLTAELDQLESWWKEFKSLQDEILDFCEDDNQLDSIIEELTEADTQRNAIKATIKRLLREAQNSMAIQEKSSTTVQRLTGEQCLLYPKFNTIGSRHQCAPTKQPLEPSPPKHTNAQHAANNVCLQTPNISMHHNTSLERFSTAAKVENYCLQDTNTENSHVSPFNQPPQENITQEDIVEQPSSQIVTKTPSGWEDQPQCSTQSLSITFHASTHYSSEIQATEAIHQPKSEATTIEKLNEIPTDHRQLSSTYYEAIIHGSTNGKQSTINHSFNTTDICIPPPLNSHPQKSFSNTAVFRSPKLMDISTASSRRQLPSLQQHQKPTFASTSSSQQVIRLWWAERIIYYFAYNSQVIAFVRRRVWGKSHHNQQGIPIQPSNSTRSLKVGGMNFAINPCPTENHQFTTFNQRSDALMSSEKQTRDQLSLLSHQRSPVASLEKHSRILILLTVIIAIIIFQCVCLKLYPIWWAECCGQQQTTGVLYSGTTPADAAYLMLPAVDQTPL